MNDLGSNHVADSTARRRSLGFGFLAFCMVVMALETSSIFAQGFPDDFFNNGFGNGNNPFDPNKMMQSFFGEPDEAEAELLAQIEISSRDERAFGQRLVDQFIETRESQGQEVTRRGPAVEYIQEIVAELRPMMENGNRYRRTQIYVIESDSLEAYSFPGGHLFFTKGMIEFCPNKAALVGVVGHELSHLDRQHQLLPLKRSKLAERTFGGQRGFDPQTMFQTFSVLSQTWMRPFRPEDEAQADLDGADWAYQADYDPREMAKLFASFGDRAKTPAGIPAFLRTHPLDEDRLRAIMNQYDDLQRRSPKDDLKLAAEEHREKLSTF